MEERMSLYFAKCREGLIQKFGEGFTVLGKVTSFEPEFEEEINRKMSEEPKMIINEWNATISGTFDVSQQSLRILCMRSANNWKKMHGLPMHRRRRK